MQKIMVQQSKNWLLRIKVNDLLVSIVFLYDFTKIRLQKTISESILKQKKSGDCYGSRRYVSHMLCKIQQPDPWQFF